MTQFLNQIKTQVRKPKRIIFPESTSEAVIEAAYKTYQDDICLPYFVGEEQKIAELCHRLGIGEDWYVVLSPQKESPNLLKNKHIIDTGIPEEALSFLLEEPLYFATAYLRIGEVDAMVAGYDYMTGEVVSAGSMFLRKLDGDSLVSSFFVMDIPEYQGSENNLLIFADCGVNVDPTSKELSIIAKDTVDSAQRLLGWEPRVAFLSSSTMGSIEHERVDKVRKAYELFKKEKPELASFGEMQADAALDKRIAEKKITEKIDVLGNSNILIFPDLDSGNIAYKLTSQLANATAYGPILQGLDKPLFDLSRGSSVNEIIGVITIASRLADSEVVK